MGDWKRIWAVAVAGVVLSVAAASLAAEYERIERKPILCLEGDFARLDACTVEGKHGLVSQKGQSALRADADLRIGFGKPLTAPYAVSAWVRFPAKQGTAGRIILTACDNPQGGYQIEMVPRGDAIDVRTLVDGCNLWAKSTYRFRESTGPEYLRYHLRLDANKLAAKLKRFTNGLEGRTEQWQEWGLGTRGQFFEARQVEGLKGVIEANEAEPSAADRWTQVALEVMPEAVRMWVDGRLVGEVKPPRATAGGVVLQLPSGALLARLEVSAAAQPLDGFVTLDLAGYCNEKSSCEAALPSGLIRVQGVPFCLGKSLHGRSAVNVGRSAPLETGFGSGFLGSAFEGASGLVRHPARIVLQLPKGWYHRAYLLAYAEREPDTEPVVSLRFFRGERTGTIIDYSCRVPYVDEPASDEAVASLKLATPQGKEAYVHVLRIPLEPTLMQSYLEKGFFRDLQLEITRGLRFTRGYPDPSNYKSLAGDKRSSVRILGLTFEESPLQMVLTSDEVGNFVVEPERPWLNLMVRNPRAHGQRASLEITAEDSCGGQQRITGQLEIPAQSALLKRYLLPLPKYGLYRVGAVLSGSKVRLVKGTTLGYLPPDTRRTGWADSAFGVWNWGAGTGGYAYPVDSEVTIRLVRKLGGRWTLSVEDPAMAKSYGCTKSWSFLPRIDFDKVPRKQWQPELKQRMVEGLRQQKAQYREQDIYLLFGEANLGLAQTFALPGRYYGEPDYKLNAAEKEKFDRLFERAVLVGKTFQQVKQEHPEFRNCKVAFGNTSPNFHIEFLKRGLPKESIDLFGIDIPYFERMPERQPRAVEASQLLYLYDFRKEAGCEDIPVVGTEDMYYPGVPGSISQREQADYYVRCHLLKFALGVTREVSVGMVFSTSGPYGRCHYGATGFFEVAPEGGGDGNPREAAVAYATMTRLLDGATFEKHFPTSSLSMFCLAFRRKFGRGDVLALWTVHGKRPVTIGLAKDAVARITDAMGNTSPAPSANRTLTVEACSSPIWVEGIKTAEVTSVKTGEPSYADKPAEPHHLVDDFDVPWQVVGARDTQYEQNNFDLPRFPGKMDAAKAVSFDGGRAFQVTLHKPGKERKLAPWYAAVAPERPIPLPGKPTKIGLYVKGNSGWGRVIPQLVDSKGEVWTFIGPKDEWNSDDIRSQSSVNFDGWKYMEMDLPGNLPNGWPGPAMGFWKNERGDRVVDYPLRLEKLFIEQRTHVYYVNEILPVPETVITLDKIICTSDDPYEGLHLHKNW